MNITIIANTSQLPKEKLLLVRANTEEEARKDFDIAAKKRGISIGQVYQWARIFYYGVVEKAEK